jgi:hypothetical protein
MRLNRIGSMLLGMCLLVVSGLVQAQSSGAARPLPPSGLCVEDDGGGGCSGAVDSGSSMKWNPGHYIMGTSRSEYSAAHLAELATIPGVKGWHQYVHWSTIEKSRGVYDWTFLDGLLALCEQHKLRLIINIKPRTFGGTGTGHLPAYLASEPGGNGGWYKHPNSGGVSPRIWLRSINDRYIALVRAIGARYNNHPYLEAFEGSETSFSHVDEATDWNYDTFMAEQKRLNVATKAAFPNTNVFALTNYSDSETQLADFIAHAANIGMGVGMPDTYPQQNGIGGARPQNLQWGERIVMGSRYVLGKWVPLVGTDYRGVVPLHTHVADPELGGKEGSWTPQQFYDHAYSSFRATHMSWSRKDYTIGGEPDPEYEDIYWNTGDQPRIKDWMVKSAASAPWRKECPRAYGGRCVTGGGR